MHSIMASAPLESELPPYIMPLMSTSMFSAEFSQVTRLAHIFITGDIAVPTLLPFR